MNHVGPPAQDNQWTWRYHCIATAILAFTGVLLFWSLGNYHFWCDEAETAVFAQNVLRMGLPYGFDGHNLFEFRNGIYLNDNLLLIALPWLQFYVAGLGMAMFGESNLGGRVLFAAAALAGMAAQYRFVCSFFLRPRLALINIALMAGSAAWLLAGRQCRYYSLAMLLSPLVLLLYTRFKGTWRHHLTVYILFQTLYFVHELVAAIFLASFAIGLFLAHDSRRAVRMFLPPLPALAVVSGLFFWWQRSVGHPDYPYAFRNVHPSDFTKIVWLYLKDYNATQLAPIALITVLAVTLIYDRWRKQHLSTASAPAVVIALCTVIFTVLLAIFSPQVSSATHSDIRYATIIYPFLLLLSALAIDRIWSYSRWTGFVVLLIALFTNWMTLHPPRYYLAAYLREVAIPVDNSVKVAVRFLSQRTRTGESILVTPNYMSPSVAFYLRDRLNFCGIIGEDNKNLLGRGLSLPPHTYSSKIHPDWIVAFGQPELPHVAHHLSKLDPALYVAHTFPILGADVTRPELFWRSFTPITNVPAEYALTVLERIDRRNISK